ncbi:MAG: hypothetical protein WCX12_00680 [Candidatus Paceibacterota bacterium]|jgi:hypothetical protein
MEGHDQVTDDTLATKPIFTGVTGPMSDEALGQLKLDVERSRQQAEIDRRIPSWIWDIEFGSTRSFVPRIEGRLKRVGFNLIF